MSKKIVVTQYVSLDGVLEDPVGMEGLGLGNRTGPFNRRSEGDTFRLDELLAGDSLIFGRKSYDAFAAAWPIMKDEAGFADRMNGLPKLVASTTLRHAGWDNSAIVDGDLVQAVSSLKAKGDSEILIYGSGSAVHQLMPHGLIDEYRLMVYPTVLGRGKRLFPDSVATTPALAEYRQLGGGIVLTRYLTA